MLMRHGKRKKKLPPTSCPCNATTVSHLRLARSGAGDAAFQSNAVELMIGGEGRGGGGLLKTEVMWST